MTRDEFLREIRRETGFMLPEDRRAVIAYFISSFRGRDEQQVINELGTPKEALKRYFNEEEFGSFSRPTGILMIIAAAVASPILIDAAVVIGAIALFLGLFAALLLAVLPFGGAALWLGGIDRVIRAFASSSSAGDMLCRIGAGLMSSGAGVFILLFVYKVYRRFIPWLAYEIRAAYRSLSRRIKGLMRRIL